MSLLILQERAKEFFVSKKLPKLSVTIMRRYSQYCELRIQGECGVTYFTVPEVNLTKLTVNKQEVDILLDKLVNYVNKNYSDIAKWYTTKNTFKKNMQGLLTDFETIGYTASIQASMSLLVLEATLPYKYKLSFDTSNPTPIVSERKFSLAYGKDIKLNLEELNELVAKVTIDMCIITPLVDRWITLEKERIKVDKLQKKIHEASSPSHC